MSSSTSLDVPILLVIILLIFLSAFFSMSETALSSVSQIKLKNQVEARERGAKKALHLVENYDMTLTTLLVGNNVVNIVISVLAVVFFGKLFKTGQYVELVATLATTVILLIFGEIIPKTIGKKKCQDVAKVIAYPVYICAIVFYPIVICFRLLQRLISGSNSSKSNIDEEELGTILDTMEEEGSIESNEVEIIKNVFDLNDRTVEDIMVHRINVVAIDISESIEEIKKTFLDTKFSRIPVYREDKDHIIGILYEREFLSALLTKNNLKIEDILRPTKYVSAAMKVGTLIHELQKCKNHMAVVSGEYGDTLGIVTMEDALEELVGEIYDEHDIVEEDVNKIDKIGENTYIVDGEIYVDSLFKQLEIGEAPEDTSQKLSSWVFEESEELPQVGNKVSIISNYTSYNEVTEDYEDYSKKITFEIAEVEERRITRVIVKIEDYVEEETEESH